MSLLRGIRRSCSAKASSCSRFLCRASLAGRLLQDSGIGSRTGLSVVALQQGDQLTAPLTSETPLPAGAELLMLGSHEQRTRFAQEFGR